MPLWNVSTLLDQTFVAERSSGLMLIRNAVFSMVKIPLLVLPLLLWRVGALDIFASWVLAAIIASTGGLAVLVPRLGRGYVHTLRGMVSQVRGMLSSFAGHHVINLGATAPMYLLPMLVTIRLSPAENAYFYITWMLGGIFFMISPAVAASLFAEGSHETNALFRKVRTSALVTSALLGPAMLAFLLGGRYIMAVFGLRYAQHGLPLLMLLIISAVPDAITNLCISVLRVQRRLRAAAGLNIGMAVLALALAWMLLPSLGIAGAGWAWLIAQTAGSVVVVAHGVVLYRRRAYTDKDIENVGA